MLAPENGLVLNRRYWKQNSKLVLCGVRHVFKVMLLTCIVLLPHFELLNNAFNSALHSLPATGRCNKKSMSHPQKWLPANRRPWKQNANVLLLLCYKFASDWPTCKYFVHYMSELFQEQFVHQCNFAPENGLNPKTKIFVVWHDSRVSLTYLQNIIIIILNYCQTMGTIVSLPPENGLDRKRNILVVWCDSRWSWLPTFVNVIIRFWTFEQCTIVQVCWSRKKKYSNANKLCPRKWANCHEWKILKVKHWVSTFCSLACF